MTTGLLHVDVYRKIIETRIKSLLWSFIGSNWTGKRADPHCRKKTSSEFDEETCASSLLRLTIFYKYILVRSKFWILHILQRNIND